MTLTAQIQTLSHELSKATSLPKSSTGNDSPTNSSRCIELLASLKDVTTENQTDENENENGRSEVSTKLTIAILNETKVGLCLSKLLKTFRRYKRSSPNDGQKKEWEVCIELCQGMLNSWKEAVKEERVKKDGARSNGNSGIRTIRKTASQDAAVEDDTSNDTKNRRKNKNGNCHKDDVVDDDDGDADLPTCVSDYRQRLIGQKKEMYKDPPVLPPSPIVIEAEYCPRPKRNSNGELSFVLSNAQQQKCQTSSSSSSSSKLLQYIKDFKPNRTPEEVLRAGSFGGTYFRPIASSVTNKQYNSSDVLKETVEPEWITNLNRSMLTSSTYNISVNKYKVKCGGSLGMWESSGWISDSDPYGWFQWYCRFYRGRRCSDDERQISRWLKSAGHKGRFRSQLCNKIFAQGRNGCGMEKLHDVTISPVIRQTLLHWGLEITEDVLRKHGKRVGKL